MGKPTGFLEFPRVPQHDREPLERIKDWNEWHLGHSEATLREQGARCMDCGVPFCQTGKLFAGMASGCPVNPRSHCRSSSESKWTSAATSGPTRRA